MKNLRAILVIAVAFLLLGGGSMALLKWSKTQVEYPEQETFLTRAGTADFISRIQDRAQPEALSLIGQIQELQQAANKLDLMRMGQLNDAVGRLQANQAKFEQAWAGLQPGLDSWSQAVTAFNEQNRATLAALKALNTAWPGFIKASEALPDEAAQENLAERLSSAIMPTCLSLDGLDYIQADELIRFLVARLARLEPALLPLHGGLLTALAEEYVSLSRLTQADPKQRDKLALRGKAAKSLQESIAHDPAGQHPFPPTRSMLQEMGLLRPALAAWLDTATQLNLRYRELGNRTHSLHALKNEADQALAALNAPDLPEISGLETAWEQLRQGCSDMARIRKKENPEAYRNFKGSPALEAYAQAQLDWLLKTRAGHRLEATIPKDPPTTSLRLADLGIKTLGAGLLVKGRGSDLWVECVQGGLTNRIARADWKEQPGAVETKWSKRNAFSLLAGGDAIRIQVAITHDPKANRDLVPDTLKGAGKSFGQFRVKERRYVLQNFPGVDALIEHCGVIEREGERVVIDFSKALNPESETALPLALTGITPGRDFDRPKAAAGKGSLIDAAQELLKQTGAEVDLKKFLGD